jgi:hypothetical protein
LKPKVNKQEKYDREKKKREEKRNKKANETWLHPSIVFFRSNITFYM